MRHQLLHAILALLLVLAQTGLLLHEADIAAHADDSESCEICLVGQSLGHAVSGTGQTPEPVSNTVLESTPSLPVIPIVRYRAFSPRAPPLTSLHS